MGRKYYQKTDVQIFREILNDNYFSENESLSEKKIQLQIQKFNKTEILISGLDVDIQHEISKLNVAEFGFREINDVKIKISPIVFENKNKLILIPKTIYRLEDKIDIPYPFTNQNKFFLEFVSDTFERLKVKAENIINQTEDCKHIELYAKKNIQMLNRIFYDSRTKLARTQKNGTKIEVYNVFVLNIFIYNTILYYQNMFSEFYKEEIKTKQCLKIELYDTLDMNIMFRPCDDNEMTKTNKLTNDDKSTAIIWNGQVNTLLTLIYDLLNSRLGNKKTILEANIEDITYILNKLVSDKNGNPINKNTIRICLKEYREDKRAKVSKKIDISKYLKMEE